MKAVLLTCVLVASGLAEAAPAGPHRASQGHPRQKRSSYGHAQQYVSPCGGASVPVPSYAPSPYHLSLAPAHHAAYAQQGYGGGGYGSGGYGGGGIPHYRSDMLGEPEMMSFSEMDQVMSEHPMARLAYAAPPSPHYGAAGLGGLLGPASLGGLVAPAVSGAPAFAVFPNANPGGCSVPLLLSCSPSIAPGRIVSTQSYGGGGDSAASGHAYREINELHHETQEYDQHQAHDGSSQQENQHKETSHQ